VLSIADGAIVGTSLKVDGHTWNRVDPERVSDMMRRVRDVRESLAAA
jgi:predicted TIM-barrel enzyme